MGAQVQGEAAAATGTETRLETGAEVELPEGSEGDAVDERKPAAAESAAKDAPKEAEKGKRASLTQRISERVSQRVSLRLSKRVTERMSQRMSMSSSRTRAASSFLEDPSVLTRQRVFDDTVDKLVARATEAKTQLAALHKQKKSKVAAMEKLFGNEFAAKNLSESQVNKVKGLVERVEKAISAMAELPLTLTAEFEEAAATLRNGDVAAGAAADTSDEVIERGRDLLEGALVHLRMSGEQ